MRGLNAMRCALIVAMCLALGGVAGCSQGYYDERGKADGPVLDGRGEDGPAEVFNFPDGFGNLATKCVGPGKRAYATTKGSVSIGEDEVIIPANALIVDDPTCKGR
ncbi:hypothetical protein ACIBSV_07300 [Embleya sp. NPDC050154]|uniref:hypothetical protein n=1 Tax=unclassified Embleya TaxID=2699296 RepID=UPI003792452C